MLFLQTFLGLILDKIQGKERQRSELRRLLLDKTPPRKYPNNFERLVREISESDLDDFIRDIYRFVHSNSHLDLFPLTSFLVVFGTVFLTWLLIVIPKIH